MIDSDREEERAEEAARRDRYFGFAGDEFSCSMEAEPSEASDTFHSPPEPDAAVEQGGESDNTASDMSSEGGSG